VVREEPGGSYEKNIKPVVGGFSAAAGINPLVGPAFSHIVYILPYRLDCDKPQLGFYLAGCGYHKSMTGHIRSIRGEKTVESYAK
jgi:hypothetical protein